MLKLLLVLVTLFRTAFSEKFGKEAYQSPELFYSASKGIFHASRGIFGALAGGFFNSSGTTLTKFLNSQDTVDFNEIMDSITSFDTKSSSFSLLVGIGLTISFLFLAWFFFLFWSFCWCCAQCCICCCCSKQEPCCCCCCCWNSVEKRPKKCFVLYTKISYSVITILLFLTTILASVASFRLYTVPSSSVSKSVKSGGSITKDLTQIVDLVNPLYDTLFKVVDNVVNMITPYYFDFDKLEENVDTINSTIYSITVNITTFEDSIQEDGVIHKNFTLGWIDQLKQLNLLFNKTEPYTLRFDHTGPDDNPSFTCTPSFTTVPEDLKTAITQLNTTEAKYSYNLLVSAYRDLIVYKSEFSQTIETIQTTITPIVDYWTDVLDQIKEKVVELDQLDSMKDIFTDIQTAITNSDQINALLDDIQEADPAGVLDDYNSTSDSAATTSSKSNAVSKALNAFKFCYILRDLSLLKLQCCGWTGADTMETDPSKKRAYCNELYPLIKRLPDSESFTVLENGNSKTYDASYVRDTIKANLKSNAPVKPFDLFPFYDSDNQHATDISVPEYLHTVIQGHVDNVFANLSDSFNNATAYLNDSKEKANDLQVEQLTQSLTDLISTVEDLREKLVDTIPLKPMKLYNLFADLNATLNWFADTFHSSAHTSKAKRVLRTYPEPSTDSTEELQSKSGESSGNNGANDGNDYPDEYYPDEYYPDEYYPDEYSPPQGTHYYSESESDGLFSGPDAEARDGESLVDLSLPVDKVLSILRPVSIVLGIFFILIALLLVALWLCGVIFNQTGCYACCTLAAFFFLTIIYLLLAILGMIGGIYMEVPDLVYADSTEDLLIAEADTSKQKEAGILLQAMLDATESFDPSTLSIETEFLTVDLSSAIKLDSETLHDALHLFFDYSDEQAKNKDKNSLYRIIDNIRTALNDALENKDQLNISLMLQDRSEDSIIIMKDPFLSLFYAGLVPSRSSETWKDSFPKFISNGTLYHDVTANESFYGLFQSLFDILTDLISNQLYRSTHTVLDTFIITLPLLFCMFYSVSCCYAVLCCPHICCSGLARTFWIADKGNNKKSVTPADQEKQTAQPVITDAQGTDVETTNPNTTTDQDTQPFISDYPTSDLIEGKEETEGKEEKKEMEGTEDKKDQEPDDIIIEPLSPEIQPLDDNHESAADSSIGMEESSTPAPQPSEDAINPAEAEHVQQPREWINMEEVLDQSGSMEDQSTS